jgi:hypothetical protein
MFAKPFLFCVNILCPFQTMLTNLLTHLVLLFFLSFSVPFIAVDFPHSVINSVVDHMHAVSIV